MKKLLICASMFTMTVGAVKAQVWERVSVPSVPAVKTERTLSMTNGIPDEAQGQAVRCNSITTAVPLGGVRVRGTQAELRQGQVTKMAALVPASTQPQPSPGKKK